MGVGMINKVVKFVIKMVEFLNINESVLCY